MWPVGPWTACIYWPTRGNRSLASPPAPYPDVVTTQEMCSGCCELGCEDSVPRTHENMAEQEPVYSSCVLCVGMSPLGRGPGLPAPHLLCSAPFPMSLMKKLNTQASGTAINPNC